PKRLHPRRRRASLPTSVSCLPHAPRAMRSFLPISRSCAPSGAHIPLAAQGPSLPLWLRSAGTDKRRSLWTAWHFALIQDYTDQPQRQQSLGYEARSFIESSPVWSAPLTLLLSPAKLSQGRMLGRASRLIVGGSHGVIASQEHRSGRRRDRAGK